MEQEEKPNFRETLRNYIVDGAREGGVGEVEQTEDGFTFTRRFGRQEITKLQEAARLPTNRRVYGQLRQMSSEGEIIIRRSGGTEFEDDQKAYDAMLRRETINISIRISTED